MYRKEKDEYVPARHSKNTYTVSTEDFERAEINTLEVSGIKDIKVLNTGGSGASEGGMGSGSKDDREKGDLKKPGEKSGTARADEDDPNTLDPIKKKVKEAEKEQDKD